MNYESIPLPQNFDGLFASIATDAGSAATVICGFSQRYLESPPLTIIDWSQDDLTPRTLARLVPGAAAALASLREETRVSAPPPDTILIDSAGAGGPLCEQAQAAGYAQAAAITADGALKYPLLHERVLAAQFYLTCGAVAIAKSALEYNILHRGIFGNHLARELRAYAVGVDPGALLVAVVNAALEAFVDPGLKGRAMMENYVR